MPHHPTVDINQQSPMGLTLTPTLILNPNFPPLLHKQYIIHSGNKCTAYKDVTGAARVVLWLDHSDAMCSRA